MPLARSSRSARDNLMSLPPLLPPAELTQRSMGRFLGDSPVERYTTITNVLRTRTPRFSPRSAHPTHQLSKPELLLRTTT